MQEKAAGPIHTSLPVRDEVAALASTGGDTQLARDLLAALLAELPEGLARLLSSLERNDVSGVAEQAHQIRGGTRYCGVPALDEALEALERAARGGERRQIEPELDLVAREIRRLTDSIG